jgi:hypothetical protein
MLPNVGLTAVRPEINFSTTRENFYVEQYKFQIKENMSRGRKEVFGMIPT